MVTPTQTATLKKLIARSGDGNDLAKRILIFLINASNDLTQQVAVTLSEGDQDYHREEISEAAFCVSVMCGLSSLTHLNEMMILMGADLRFGFRRGHYGEDGIFEDEARAAGITPVRHTFWLSIYGQGCPPHRYRVSASRTVLDSIDLSSTHGLYASSNPVAALSC